MAFLLLVYAHTKLYYIMLQTTKLRIKVVLSAQVFLDGHQLTEDQYSVHHVRIDELAALVRRVKKNFPPDVELEVNWPKAG